MDSSNFMNIMSSLENWDTNFLDEISGNQNDKSTLNANNEVISEVKRCDSDTVILNSTPRLEQNYYNRQIENNSDNPSNQNINNLNFQLLKCGTLSKKPLGKKKIEPMRVIMTQMELKKFIKDNNLVIKKPSKRNETLNLPRTDIVRPLPSRSVINKPTFRIHHAQRTFQQSPISSSALIQTQPANIEVQTALLKNEDSIGGISLPSYCANSTVGSRPNSCRQNQTAIVVKSKSPIALPRIVPNPKFKIVRKKMNNFSYKPYSTTDKKHKSVTPHEKFKDENIFVEEQQPNLEVQSQVKDISQLTIIDKKDAKLAAIEDYLNGNMGTNDKSIDVTENIPCIEKSFLDIECLQQRIKSKLLKSGLQEPEHEVAQIISKACEERMKHLLTQLLLITKHRLQELNRLQDCEKTSDPKAQLKFLEQFEEFKNERLGNKVPEVVNLKISDMIAQECLENEKQRSKDIVEVAFAMIGTKKIPKSDRNVAETSTSTSSSYKALKSLIKKSKSTIEDLKNLCTMDLDLRNSQFENLLYRLK